MNKLEKYNYILIGFGSNILGNILMFSTTIYLTRTYQPEIYGEFRFIFSFISLSVIILLFGRDNGIIYFSQNKKNKENIIIKEETYFGSFLLFVGTLSIYFFSEYIIQIFKNIKLEYFKFSLIMIPLWGFFNLLLAGLKAQGLINYTFILSNLIQRAIRLPFLILLTIISISYYSLAFAMILSQVVLIYLAIQKLPFLLNLKDINFRNFFKRFSYSIKLGFNAIIVVLLTKIDVIMVGKYTDNIQVAIYDTCVMLSFVIMLPFVALVKSSEPFMKALISIKEVQNKYKKNLKLSIELSLGVLLFFIIASKNILYIFGETYTSGSNALIILSISYMLLIILGTPIEILNMNGFAKTSTIILIISIIINIGLNMYLIPIYGIIGASIATGVSLLFGKVIGLFLIKSKFNINFIYQLFNIQYYTIFGVLLSLSILLNIQDLIYNLVFSIFITMLYFLIVILSIKNKILSHEK